MRAGVCVRSSTWLFASAQKTKEERVHKVTSHQLFDFPSFPGKQLQEQCTRRKTTKPLTIEMPQKKGSCLLVTELLPSLEIGSRGNA